MSPSVSSAGTPYEIAAADAAAASSWGRQLRLERGSLLWACQAREAPSSGLAGNAAGSREAPKAAAATESPAAERTCKLFQWFPTEIPSAVLNANRKSHTAVTVTSQFFFSTLACQWGVPPWEASGWMVCGAGLGVWRVKVSVEALQAAWGCGMRL